MTRRAICLGFVAAGFAWVAVSFVNAPLVQAEITFLNSWGTEGSGNGQFNAPCGVAVGNAGQVYVTDGLNNRVQVFDSAGLFLTNWGPSGALNAPEGIAVDTGGRVYVADVYNNRIQQFSATGAVTGTLVGTAGSFYHPQGVATSAGGTVYVADTYNHRVQVFDASGGFVTQWGTEGTGHGQFKYPGGIAVNSEGTVFVADQSNNRIQKFSAGGVYLGSWGSFGSGYGQFNEPWGVAVGPNDAIYVCDAKNNRFQKFDENGKFLAACTGNSSPTGQLNNPIGIAVNTSGQIYVAEMYGDRVQRFSDVRPIPSAVAVHADALQDRGLTGAGVKVGVLDWNSVDTTCPVVSGAIVTWAATAGSHPTQVAAIAAGNGTTLSGTYVGMAPQAQILSAGSTFGSLLDPRGGAGEWTQSVHSGPNSLVSKSADVIVTAIGRDAGGLFPASDGRSEVERLLDHVVDYHGVVVVAAAGNRPRSPNGIPIVAAAFNTIVVGAADSADGIRWDRVSLENVIPGTSDGRQKPDILAPGNGTTLPYQDASNSWYHGAVTGATSWAAPHVAGAAALLRQLATEQSVSDRTTWQDPRVVKSVLLTSADKLAGQDLRWTHSQTQPLDKSQGAGLLDAKAAYELYAPGPQPGGLGLWTVPEGGWDCARVNPGGGVQTYVIGSVLAPGDQLISTLVWNRHVDEAYSDSPLTNLSLLLCKHGSGAGADYSNSAVDNVEHIVYTVPYGQGGQYELRVVNGGAGVAEDYGLAWRVIRQGVDLPRTMTSNGDFAAGALTGWHVAGNASAVQQPDGYGDYWAARLVGDGSGIDQTVQIEAQRLTLEFDYRFDGTGSDLVALLGGVQVGSALEHVDGEWHRAFFDIDASSWAGGTAPLAFMYSTSDPNSGVLIDGISLTPEPATLSLLALGGLALLRRRCK